MNELMVKLYLWELICYLAHPHRRERSQVGAEELFSQSRHGGCSFQIATRAWGSGSGSGAFCPPLPGTSSAVALGAPQALRCSVKKEQELCDLAGNGEWRPPPETSPVKRRAAVLWEQRK